MSNKTFNDMWMQSQMELEKLATTDFEFLATEPIMDKKIAQTRIYELYLKYITLANKLDEIYDQMLQPQKRSLIKKLLEACLGRICELKQDLVKIDMSEFSYNDELIAKYKLTPLDTELHIPKFFLREREEELRNRNRFQDDILKRLGLITEDVEEEPLTELEAIKIIQLHERARQGRLRAQFMKEIRSLKEKGKPERSKAETGLMAAIKIQKVWRGYASRIKTMKERVEEMVLVGMLPGESQKAKVDELKENMKNERYKLQAEYKEIYAETLQKFEEEIIRKQGANMSENMADLIRTWFHDYYNKTGKFPDYPSEEAGGSRQLLSRQGTESELSRSSASKESKRIAKEKAAKEKTKTEEVLDENIFKKGFTPDDSAFLQEIKTGIEEYNDVWKNMDERGNLKQLPYNDMIYTEKFAEIEQKLRRIVDDMMRSELNLLQTALDKDRAAKGKKTKKAGKKARRSGKKGKKKKEKDLTPDRTTESLFEELVTNGIIVKYPEFPLKNYLGDKSFTARSGTNPTPGDIRQLLIELCILPLGSAAVKNFAPPVKSILIAGPKGTGKRSLVHAVCTEVGAVMFDLSPANLMGKYPGKTGLIMLMHLVLKVSRLLQPAVIYFEDAEKPFMKKVPKTDRTDPKRLKKDLPKLLKNINPEDRVILIGTSNQPWDADQKLLQQAYNRFIYIPRPDYGALEFAWRELLKNYSGIQRNFETSGLAKVSDGFTVGAVATAIKSVITTKRMLQLRVKPLTHVELINGLSLQEPVYLEEQEMFNSWWIKTPLGRLKQRIWEIENQDRLEREALDAKRKAAALK